MTATGLVGGVALLERAVNYALGSLLLVTPEAMTRPTPCRGWDLRELLAHLDDSLLALHEAIDLGHVDLRRTDLGGPAADPVRALRDRACLLLGAWTNARREQSISVAGLSLTTGVVSSAGALEIAVHGWDVARACGRDRPIPASLAEEMLHLAPLFVTEADRPVRFAAPVDLPPTVCPGARLVAFLGRVP